MMGMGILAVGIADKIAEPEVKRSKQKSVKQGT